MVWEYYIPINSDTPIRKVNNAPEYRTNVIVSVHTAVRERHSAIKCCTGYSTLNPIGGMGAEPPLRM